MNLILAKKDVTEKIFDEEILIQSGISTNLFKMFQRNPLNNILHNLVTTFIIRICNSNLTRFQKCLTANSDYFENLEKISNEVRSAKSRQKTCYLGHIKKISNLFLKSLLKNETDERWLKFRDNFLQIENEKENKALGDVYVNNDNDENEIMFTFSFEEIKEKYSVFLGFKKEEAEAEINKIKDTDVETAPSSNTTETSATENSEKAVKSLEEETAELEENECRFWNN